MRNKSPRFRQRIKEIGLIWPESLTDLHLRVLEEICKGEKNLAIAVNMGSSIKTIEKHRQKLMNDLGIHSVAGLVVYAGRKGLLQLEGIRPATGMLTAIETGLEKALTNPVRANDGENVEAHKRRQIQGAAMKIYSELEKFIL